jgi:hypothetical protein
MKLLIFSDIRGIAVLRTGETLPSTDVAEIAIR